MTQSFTRRFVTMLALVVGLAFAGDTLAQGTSGANPPPRSVTEEQLFQQLDKLTGRITIPDRKAAVLQQPQGREYRAFHEGTLPWIGGIFIIGMIIAIAAFYFTKGRIMMEPGEESGRKILRFNAFERFTHWMTATAFIVLAITGLNFVFGKRLLMPLIGADAFASWSQWAKYAHDFFSWAFMLGILIMLVVWIRDNLPDRYDANWLKEGGGMFDKSNHTHPPAGRFNTGQKLIFWAVVLGGAALSVSGIFLLFPFAFTDVNGMQLAQTIHAIVAALMVAVILAHIYIGTLGMEGAFEAMGSGTVDLNWAKEHHSAWVEKQRDAGAPPKRAATPAE